ncbi:MAG: metal ABC transporter permease [Rubrobacter sp.]|nr:metal ABC transporter permease [Rubrobacter sp.]
MLYDLLFDYTLRNVALGSAVLGVAGGALGCFAVLRRQGLLGDALAHATLPGVCVAFILVGTGASWVLLAGAAVAAMVGALVIIAIVEGTRIKYDAALGIVLSVFFGFGTVLLTYIAGTGASGQSGLDRFLFGQAASIVREDVITMGALTAGVLLVVALLFKEFKLLAFDPVFAASMGFRVGFLNVLLTSLIVVAIIVGLQAVGVVLVVALLITPAVSARQWTERLSTMILVSGLFGAFCGVTGALISASGSNLPTGPLIVLTATGLLVLSLFLGRKRGLLWSFLRDRRNRREALRSASAGGAG